VNKEQKVADFDIEGSHSYVKPSIEDRVFGTTQRPIDKIVGKEDHLATAPAMYGVPMPPVLLPVNKATMECARGPCMHFWAMTAKMDSQSDKIDIGRAYQCNCHSEATELAEQNIFHCNQWWPLTLAWLPESVRGLLRPRLRWLWEHALKWRGYDFSWRTWTDDVFEADADDKRELSTFWRWFKTPGTPGRKTKPTLQRAKPTTNASASAGASAESFFPPPPRPLETT
jgi:hypothetical protein